MSQQTNLQSHHASGLLTPCGLSVLLLLIIQMAAMTSMAAQVDVTQYYVAGANNGRYDRNPSFVVYGGENWLFYTKADNAVTAGVRNSTYNPDNDTYVIWYKKITAPEDMATAPEVRLDLSETARPEGFDQRDVSAVVFNNLLYLFASAGFGGSQQSVYYYVWDGTVWSGPVSLGTIGGGHVNAVCDANRVYLSLETGVDVTLQSIVYTWDGSVLNGPYTVASGNGVPKLTLMDNKLYVVSIAPGATTINLHSADATATPAVWTYLSDPITVSDSYVWDPSICNDGVGLLVLAAPSTSVPDRQWIVQTRSTDNGLTWSPVRPISSGGCGATTWWEYWPIAVATDQPGRPLIFFTTEGVDGVYGDGMIGAVGVDWSLDHSHSFYIQPAIDMAAVGDTVKIGGSTFKGCGNRDLDFAGKALLLRASGDDSTIIDCQGTALDPHHAFSFHSGENGAVIEGLVIKNAYAGASDGAVFCTGAATKPIIRNCGIMKGTGAGLRVLGGASPTVEKCVIAYNTGDGISVGSFYTSPANITVKGSLIAHNGGAGIRAESSVNTVIDSTTMACNGAGCVINVGEPPARGSAYDWSLVLQRSIAAFNSGDGIVVTSYFGTITVECNDSYGNGGVDYSGGYGNPSYPPGNISANPLFCDTAAGDFHLALNSPCAGYNSCATWMGALDVACPGVFLCGDANDDGNLNVGDVVFIINYVFKNGKTPDWKCEADANHDGKVNVADAVYMINFIFKDGPGPVTPCCS